MKHRREEPVRLDGKRYGYLPDAFTWRGRRYHVHCVERTWTLARGSGARRLERRYFRVRCGGATFDIYHDLVANTWRVAGGAR